MFYYLSELKDLFFALNVFKYITFRAAMAAITPFLLCVVTGPVFIEQFKKRKIREIAKRDDCPDLAKFHEAKEGTPTMGGIFMVGSIIISVLLWANLSNRYIALTLATCLYLAILGYVDDYVKLSRKKKARARASRKNKIALADTPRVFYRFLCVF